MGRLFRAFRVMRLIKRITSLRLIINAAVSSLPSLTSALLMLALLEATFAIIAKNSWGTQEPTLAKFDSALFSVNPPPSTPHPAPHPAPAQPPPSPPPAPPA